MYVCMYACMYVCMYVCTHVCMHMFSIRTYRCVFMYINTLMQAHTYTQTVLVKTCTTHFTHIGLSSHDFL